MVFTHLPSNVLLMLVPLMPTVELAILVLLARFQHQPDGRADAPELHDGGRRSRRALRRRGRHGHRADDGAALSPLIAAPLFAVPGLAAVPFFLAGGLKIVYDLALWRAFRAQRHPRTRADRG